MIFSLNPQRAQLVGFRWSSGQRGSCWRLLLKALAAERLFADPTVEARFVKPFSLMRVDRREAHMSPSIRRASPHASLQRGGLESDTSRSQSTDFQCSRRRVCVVQSHPHQRIQDPTKSSRSHLANELGVGVEVLGGGHGDEAQQALVTQRHVRPASHRQNALGRRHAVVRHQNLADRPLAAVALPNKVPTPSLSSILRRTCS